MELFNNLLGEGGEAFSALKMGLQELLKGDLSADEIKTVAKEVKEGIAAAQPLVDMLPDGDLKEMINRFMALAPAGTPLSEAAKDQGALEEWTGALQEKAKEDPETRQTLEEVLTALNQLS